MLNEKKEKKKCLRLFNKKTPSYAGLGSKQKTFSNCQAIYQKEPVVWKSGNFFQSANVQIGWTPPSPVRFSLLFKDLPLHDECTFWMTPWYPV